MCLVCPKDEIGKLNTDVGVISKESEVVLELI